MSKHVQANLKAYASLVGAVATALSTVYDSKPLTAVVAVAAALVVWRVPNTDA